MFNAPGDVPGPPVQFGPTVQPATVQPGEGFTGIGLPENDIFYFHSDHLGSTSYISNKNGSISQHVEYIAFGEVLFEEHSSSFSSPYLFNGKELDEETGLYYYGARYYDPRISVWLSVDPLAGKLPFSSPYAYVLNNPVRYVDPDGRMVIDLIPLSTHLDENGKVVAVLNDGDNGVYQYGKNADGGSVTKYQLSRRGTSSGGTRVGETAHWDEFVNPETGKAMTETTVQIGKSFDPVISEMHGKAKDMNLLEIASASAGGGIFDIKKDYVNVGALLNGKYATSRSAGNFLAGYNASTGSYLGVGISFTTFQKLAGALHIEESHKKRLGFWQKVDIVTLDTYISSDISKFKAPTYGEVNYQYRMSKAGWNYGTKNKVE